MLVGRERERGEIERALASAREGRSATLALLGEPGIGKTALLGYAADSAAGMHVLRARGIESEAQIPFASLLELLRPALAMLDRIPEPQAVALEGALALRPATSHERFAVGAATLSLLAAHAEQGPTLVLVDDAHWLDRSSAQALLFAVRRLVADPVAVLLGVRAGEPSLLDGADVPTLVLGGLSSAEAGLLLGALSPQAAERLHRAAAGNPLALLELESEASELELAPEGAPLLVSDRIADAFLRRLGTLDQPARTALLLAATSDRGDVQTLRRAAVDLDADLAALAAAERAGFVTVRAGSVEFRHPLVRSAVYAHASAEERRAAHRALAAALPDRDIDRRAWHLASAAVGADGVASAALAQAAARARERSAYAAAAAAFERAGQLASEHERRAALLCDAAAAAWDAGLGERALALLAESRTLGADDATALQAEQLRGHIATSRGPVMEAHAILTAAAQHADDDQAVEMLAEAASACFYAGEPREMLAVAERARGRLSDRSSPRARFLASTATGMALIVGGDAAAGAATLREAVALAETSSELRDDAELVPWFALAPIFLRESGSGRPLVEHALAAARRRAAVGTLPYVLNQVARDEATSDRWAQAEATYREAIELARESDQNTQLVFALAGLAWLQARRGRREECRAYAEEALSLSSRLGTRLHEVWASAALGESALGAGDAAEAVAHFERQRALLADLGITDADLSPAPELVDAYLKLARHDDAARLAAECLRAAEAKGQPWSLARALRSVAMVAEGDSEKEIAARFEAALREHEHTPDAFESARTRLAYGERLRRARERVRAREQLRAALATFERLDARPWLERASVELAASGETLRRRDGATTDELTPQELQIALLLAGGRTTREAAAALFLSPKTIEYHLRHVYMKLDIHSREELARAFEAGQPPS